MSQRTLALIATMSRNAQKNFEHESALCLDKLVFACRDLDILARSHIEITKKKF